MIYNHETHPLHLDASQYRLHLDPHRSHGTCDVRLYQVPLPQKNPGGHLAYLVDHWVIDMPERRLTSHDSLAVLFVESMMQKRLPGLD